MSIKFASKCLGAVCLFSSMAMAEPIRVPGTISGFGSLRADDIVDGAIVLKTLRGGDLLNFRIEQLIAPDEPMRAGPETVEVPGNLFFPTQSEFYGGLFKVTIEKPEFGYYSFAGDVEEVVATSFKVPFSDLVDMAQSGNTSPSKLLPLMRVNKMSYLEEADHSELAKMRMNLTHSYTDRLSFSWGRASPGADESDHIFAFEQTPLGRWALADLVGNAGSSGKVKNGDAFRGDMKVLFVRLREVEKKIQEISALVKSQSEILEGSVTAEGVAARWEGVSMNGTTISWNPIEEMGWVAVLHQRAEAPVRLFPDRFGFSFGLHNQDSQVLEHSWVDPKAGSFTLSQTPAQGDLLNLIFVRSAQEVPAPGLEDNPLLFDHAQEIRILNLN